MIRSKPRIPEFQRSRRARNTLGAWCFTEGAGYRSADLTGRHPVTFEADGSNVPVWTMEHDGPAVQFAGVGSGRITTAEKIAWGQKVSLVVQCRPSAATTQPIMAKDGGDLLQLRLNQIRYYTSGLTNDYVAIQFMPYSAGDLLRLAVTVDGTAVRFYRDGRLVGTNSVTTNAAPLDQPVQIGWWRSDRFRGDISYIQIFDRVLSPAEINRILRDPYAEGRPAKRVFSPLYVTRPPENLAPPSLTPNPDGTWNGSVGTWANGPTSYAWELRLAEDDSVVASGTGTGPSGAGLTEPGLFYLWVQAINSGGATSAVSATVEFTPLSREHQIAGVIAAALNSADPGTFPLEFTAERHHLVRFDTKQLATLRVSVAPVAKTSRPVARGVWLEEHVIGVGIQKKLDSGDQVEQLDVLARLTEAVERHLQNDELRELAGGVMVDIDRNPIADPVDLAERKYFAQVRLTYQLERETDFTFIEPPAADPDLAGEHQIASAVADALNAADTGTFDQAFTAERHHLVRFDTLQLQTLRVSVAPLAKPARPAARYVWTEQHSIGIAVQWKLEHADQLAQCDRLALLSQQVEDYLQADDLTELAGGQLLSIDRDPVADPEALMEREYRAVLRLTYQRDIDTN